MKEDMVVPVSVVIASSGDALRLEWTLEGLCRQDFPQFEVIVVNDGQDPALLALLARFAGRLDLQYFYLHPRCDTYRGARARNTGARLSRGEWLIFVDEDCVPPAGYARAFWEARQEKRIAYGLRWNRPQQQVQPFAGHFSFSALREGSDLDFRIIQRDEWLQKPAYSQAWAHSLGLPASLFLALGGYDETFVGWGWEDFDLNLRVLQAGGHLHRLGEAATQVHLAHPSRFDPTRPSNESRVVPGEPTVVNGGPLQRFLDGTEG